MTVLNSLENIYFKTVLLVGARLKISVSTDGTTWTQVRHVKADELKVNSQTITVNRDGSSTSFFENAKAEGNLYVCDAAYVKVEMPAVGANNNVSVQNIDL